MKESDDEQVQNNIKSFIKSILGTKDHSNEFKSNDISENANMALISYIIPPIPFFVERSSKYVKFHSKQAMNNLIWLIIFLLFLWILDVAFSFDHIVKSIRIIGVVFYLAICGFGFYNVYEKKARELPLVSKLNFIDLISNFF